MLPYSNLTDPGSEWLSKLIVTKYCLPASTPPYSPLLTFNINWSSVTIYQYWLFAVYASKSQHGHIIGWAKNSSNVSL